MSSYTAQVNEDQSAAEKARVLGDCRLVNPGNVSKASAVHYSEEVSSEEHISGDGGQLKNNSWFSWETFKLGAHGDYDRSGSDSKCSKNQRTILAHMHWKPITLRAPILASFAVFSLAVVIVLEALARKSTSNGSGGGLVFADDIDRIPAVATFG